MREPLRDTERLNHILQAIDNVEEFSSDLQSADALKQDKIHLHAIVFNVQIIGEAVYKLSLDFKDGHPDTPWDKIEKMRHILVHDYYRINLDIMWSVIKKDLPALKAQVESYLR